MALNELKNTLLFISIITLPNMILPMEASTSLFETVFSYNPVSAVLRRTPFASCIIKAACNTAMGRKAPTLNTDNKQLPDAQDLAQQIHNALRFHEHIKPEDFLWGAGTSAHQVDGNCSPDTCSWARWELEQLNKKVLERAGLACDHWKHYQTDITNAHHDLGMNSYRFSIEWSRVEPRKGEFNEAALAHYADMCKVCIQHGIKPIIGLHHYTDPCWFIDQGGFEKKENIAHFTKFCATTCDYLYKEVVQFIENKELLPLICTFNSQSGYAAKGYLQSEAPPGRQGDMQAMQTVIANTSEAHVQTYKALKQIGGDKFQIGILINIHQLYAGNPCNPLSQLGASAGQMLTNEGLYNFFTTGTYNVYMPFKALVEHTNYDAPESLDFIGLNHYSLGMMDNFQKNPHPDANTHTANKNYCISPESLHLAINEISTRIAKPLNIPIYITENGTAPIGDDPAKKNKFYQRYLYAMLKSIKEGHDVRGYITWSLLDNFEWNSGYKIAYGLYHVDFNDPDRKRTLKPGAEYLKRVIKTYAKL